MYKRIDFEKSGRIKDINQKICDYLLNNNPNEPIILDMSSIEYIQIQSLVYLIALITKRLQSQHTTKVQYPEKEEIRSFLNTTRFFQIINNFTGLQIHDYVVGLPDYFDRTYLSTDYLERPKYEYDDKGNRIKLSDEEKIEASITKGFYPIVSIPFRLDSDKSIALKEEPKKWTEEKTIISLIQKNLPNKAVVGNRISKHIIYESITNAIRHPNSDKLVISCIRQEEYYTLVIWDSGESMIDTLYHELDKGNPIKTEQESPDDPSSCYCIVKEKKAGPPSIDSFEYFFSNEIPTLSNNDVDKDYLKEKWFVLLSLFFPGITRDPYFLDYEKGVLRDEKKPELGGRGLTYLLNEAVRYFGGEVRVRTSNYYIKFRKAENAYKTLPHLFFDKFKNEFYVIDMKNKYDSEGISAEGKKIINSLFNVSIKEYPKESSFYGNMITIQFPQS